MEAEKDIYDEIITHEEIHEFCSEMVMFGDCVFVKDFGPYKIGDKISLITFLPETREIHIEEKEGDPVKKFRYSIQCCEEILEE